MSPVNLAGATASRKKIDSAAQKIVDNNVCGINTFGDGFDGVCVGGVSISMWNEKTQDLGLGLLVLVIAIGGFLFVNPTDAPVSHGPGGMSWQSLPFIYSGLLLILAIVFIASTLVGMRNGGGKDDQEAGKTPDGLIDNTRENTLIIAEKPDILSTVRRVSVVLCLILYTLLLDAFGFAMTTPFFLFAMLYTFGRRNLVENTLISGVGGSVLWVLFDFLLKMPLRGKVWDPLTPALTGLLRGLIG